LVLISSPFYEKMTIVGGGSVKVFLRTA